MNEIEFLNSCDGYPRNFAVHTSKEKLDIPIFFRYKSDAACYRDFVARKYGFEDAWIEEIRGSGDK